MKVEHTVFYECKDAIALVTIRHPPVNVLNEKVLDDLESCVAQLHRRPELRCIVITGTGDSFLAGGDIREYENISEENFVALTGKANRVFSQFEGFPIPVIAAVNGHALGGGLELALACDIRIAAETVKMSLPETRVGMIPSYGGTARLAKLIGPGMAKYMTFTGERITAQRAWEVGIMQRVVPYEELMPTAMKVAAQIAAGAPIAMREIKAVINRVQELTVEQALELEAAAALTAARSEDIKEGVAAFLEKRPPTFRNQ